MPEIPDSTALHDVVARIVDQATERLTTAAHDAQGRQEELTAAKKDAGNSRRSHDIRAALDAEDRLVVDARALAERMAPVKQLMAADLGRLLAVSLDVD